MKFPQARSFFYLRGKLLQNSLPKSCNLKNRALEKPEILKQVIENKSIMFPDPKASYQTAFFGQLRLIPSDIDLEIIKRDYVAMTDMFTEEPPEFEIIMKELKTLENILNKNQK